MDGIFNLLVGLSTFLIGILIVQRDFITSNIFLLFPLVGIVITMVLSFAIGTIKGIFGQSMRFRVLAYCLLMLLPIWYGTIIGLTYLVTNTSGLPFFATMFVASTLLCILTLVLSRAFSNWFEERFPYLFDKEKNIWNNLYSLILTIIIIIVLVSIISTVIIFISWGLPLIIKST
jgi:hypothetical protein